MSLCERNKLWFKRTPSHCCSANSPFTECIMHLCVKEGVRGCCCLSQLNVKHGCVSGQRDRNNEQPSTGWETTITKSTSTECLIPWPCHRQPPCTLQMLPLSLHGCGKEVLLSTHTPRHQQHKLRGIKGKKTHESSATWARKYDWNTWF